MKIRSPSEHGESFGLAIEETHFYWSCAMVLEKAEIQMLTEGFHATPLCPTQMQNQKITRLDVSHLSLCTWISYTTLAKHIPNLKVAFLPFGVLQGKIRALQSPQQSHQSGSNRSNLLSPGTASSVTWELFPCRCDPPGYKHCQDADCQHAFIGHIKNGG